MQRADWNFDPIDFSNGGFVFALPPWPLIPYIVSEWLYLFAVYIRYLRQFAND